MMSIKPALHAAAILFSSLLIITSSSAFAADKATIKKGEQLYNQNCSFCHQADAIGKPGFAPSLTNPEFLSISSDKFLEGTIRDGRAGTGMPPFSHLGRKTPKPSLLTCDHTQYYLIDPQKWMLSQDPMVTNARANNG